MALNFGLIDSGLFPSTEATGEGFGGDEGEALIEESEDVQVWEVDGSETQLKTPDEIDMQSKKIINVIDPTANQEAATKKYVDDNVGAAGAIGQVGVNANLGAENDIDNGAYEEITNFNTTITNVGKVLIIAHCAVDFDSNDDDFYLKIYRDGNPISDYSRVTALDDVNNPMIICCHIDDPAPGAHTYSAWGFTDNGDADVAQGRIIAIDLKV